MGTWPTRCVGHIPLPTMADAVLGAGARLGLLLHPKGSFDLAALTSAGCADPLVVDALASLPDGEAFAYSPDGRKLAIATATAVHLYSSDTGAALSSATVSGATALVFSPDASLLLTWAKKTGEDANMLVLDAATGARRAAFHQRTWAPDVFAWSADGKVAAKLFPDSVQVFDGTFPPVPGSGAPTPLSKLEVDGVKSMWLSPGCAPYTIVTFAARSKSKPGSVCLWAYPRAAGAPPLAAKSLQADDARACFAPDGALVLVEMSTESSADSYYGDSRLFLFDRTGKLAVPVPGLKEGPTHDFCWSPKADCFVTISGKSPPLAQLHAARTGAPTFSFGTAAFNTARFAPHGRFLLLGGFGNMPGDISLWDVNKKKPLAPTFNAPCTVGVEWSPDSRYLLTSTTRPRLNVDNGYRLFSHRGVRVGARSFEQLYHALWRPAPAAAFADRAASAEPPADRGAAAAGSPTAAAAGAACAAAGGAAATPTLAASPSAKGSAYVPPHLRKTGGVNLVSEMMRSDHKAAGAIKPGTFVDTSSAVVDGAAAAVAAGLPVGAAPAPLSKGQLKKKKEAEKKEREREQNEAAAALAAASAAAAAADALAAAPPVGAVEEEEEERDPAKLKRKLEKRLRQIEALREREGAGEALDAEQRAKLASAESVLQQLAALRV